MYLVDYFCLSAYPTSCSLVKMHDIDYLYGERKGFYDFVYNIGRIKLVEKEYSHTVYMGRTGDFIKTEEFVCRSLAHHLEFYIGFALYAYFSLVAFLKAHSIERVESHVEI